MGVSKVVGFLGKKKWINGIRGDMEVENSNGKSVASQGCRSLGLSDERRKLNNRQTKGRTRINATAMICYFPT